MDGNRSFLDINSCIEQLSKITILNRERTTADYHWIQFLEIHIIHSRQLQYHSRLHLTDEVLLVINRQRWGCFTSNFRSVTDKLLLHALIIVKLRSTPSASSMTFNGGWPFTRKREFEKWTPPIFQFIVSTLLDFISKIIGSSESITTFSPSVEITTCLLWIVTGRMNEFYNEIQS